MAAGLATCYRSRVATQTPPGYRRDVLPLHLEPLQAEARAASRAEFDRLHPQPFLVYTRSHLWDRTLLVPADSTSGVDTGVARYELYEGGMTFVHPIAKRQTDPRRAEIVLGRGARGDLVVPVRSVSSAHVAFIPPAPGATSWAVSDLGSKNGTWLGEDRLEPHEARPIAEGQYLRLGGNLMAWFFGPARLWEILRAPAELRRYTEV